MVNKHTKPFFEAVEGDESALEIRIAGTSRRVENLHALGKEMLYKGNAWTRDIVIFSRILLWFVEPAKIGKYVAKYCGSDEYNLRAEARKLLDETLTRKDHQATSFAVKQHDLVASNLLHLKTNLSRMVKSFLVCENILKEDEELEVKHARKFLAPKGELKRGLELEELLPLIHPYIVEFVSTIATSEM
jgi:hypothetical protein